MGDKLNLAVLCGGQSAEHEISVMSAQNVIKALDRDKYQLRVIYVCKKGGWYLVDSPEQFLTYQDPWNHHHTEQFSLLAMSMDEDSKTLVKIDKPKEPIMLDVVFPVLHGPNGEDGTMQGLLSLANVAYVGSRTMSSAIAMDKDVAKRLLRAGNIAVSNWFTFYQEEISQINFDVLKTTLGLPMFIKPANLGSSLGISKVNNLKEFEEGIQQALQYDYKIIIEETIQGREIECSVLGNYHLEASLPGEIVPKNDFYDFNSKYYDENGAELFAPADLPTSTIEKIQTTARKAFRILCCEGLARVDFFVTPEQAIYVNEINTIPGFTRISMYPKLWEVSGLPYSQLMDTLISLAMDRHAKIKKLKTSSV